VPAKQKPIEKTMHRIEAIAVYQPTTNSKQLAQKRPELANESQNDQQVFRT